MEENPIMLLSEHKRILSSAQKRADERVREAKKIGYWMGIGHTVWITGMGAYFALVAGFTFGVWSVSP